MTFPRIDGVSRLTAGALRLVEARTTNPRSVDVTDYLNRMTVHCPYLAPSLARGLTAWTVYRITGSADAVEAELFHAGVQAAECIRPLSQRPQGALVCEDVVILGQIEGIRHRDLTAWPHWALKNLYGPVGVMFGKFHADEEEFDRAGDRIPTAPVSFMPVRPAVRRRDPRLLEDTPALADALAVAVDDGRDVFAHIPYEWKAVRAWSRTKLPALGTR